MKNTNITKAIRWFGSDEIPKNTKDKSCDDKQDNRKIVNSKNIETSPLWASLINNKNR